MECIAKLTKFNRFGSKLGLSRIEELLSLMGNPEKDLKVIHIGGTNGKGSISKFIYNILLENGYCVGLYTSPFLKAFNERIEANGRLIGEKELDQLIDRVVALSDTMKEPPTEFEVVTAIALQYFKDQNLDFVILEVGLGGRGDSTNAIKKPLISIITSISYDHMDRLGETLEEIAFEKAGIIKTGVPILMNVEDKSAKQVIAREAYKKNARLYDLSKIKYSILNMSITGSTFTANVLGQNYSEVTIKMVGKHQITNSIGALACIEILRKNGIIKVQRTAIYKGLKEAKNIGRFEVIDGEIPYILDGAHNLDALKKLKETLEYLLPEKKILTVVGILEEKATSDVISEIASLSSDFITSTPNNPRALSSDKLRELLKDKNVIFSGEPTEVVEYIKNLKEYEYILFTGSLYFIGQIIELIGGN